MAGGASTPWREWDGLAGPEGKLIFFREGTRVGERSLLAEALRQDGVGDNLGHAYRIAETGRYEHGFYGWVDTFPVPFACDARGQSESEETVTLVRPCIFVVMEAA